MATSAAAELNETEQKRRKLTLERAKANHLSRQLQMRLQYARLKVEHGWQKQNLNEVENLYFHHSQKGPRSSMAGKHSWITTTTIPTVPTVQAASRFEDPAQPAPSTERNKERQKEDPIPGVLAFHVIPPPLDPAPAPVSLQGNLVEDPPADSTDPESMIVWDPPEERSSPPQTTTEPPKPVPKPPLEPLTRQPTLSTSELVAASPSPFGFPTASLTYDSFWSTHSSSSMAYRGSRSSLSTASASVSQ